MENVYYPPTIRETTPSSSEAKGALKEAEAAKSKAALAITAPDEPARESELSGATETNEGLNLEVPQKTAESTADAQAPHAEESALLVRPLQTIPPSEGSKDPKTTSTQLSKERIKTKLKKKAILASFCFFFPFFPFFFFF